MRKASRTAVLLIMILLLSQPAHLRSQPPPNSLQERIPDAVRVAGNSANFTITIYPLSQTVRIGEQANYQITLNSTNAFAGQVSLQKENFPQELLGSFNQTVVNLRANSIAKSTLTINTISVGEETFYEFTILATSGSITQRANISLTVLAQSAPPSIVSYGFLVAVLLFSAFIIWYGLRSRRFQQQQREEISEQPKPPPV